MEAIYSKSAKHRHITRLYLLKYTLIFAVFSLGAFLVFLRTGKSFVWYGDGDTQYLPYLAYMGAYLRDFVRRALQGDFTLKMFEFTAGYGDDVGSIVRAHPLDFISVLVPMRYTEQLYHALILLRIYLSGLCFSAFCFYWELPDCDVLTGAMIYAFSGYALRFGIVHPFFMAPFIVLPILLLGAEKMMRRDGGHLILAVSVFIGFMSSYYFMYMSALALLGYVLIRFPFVYRKERPKHFILLFFRMAGAFLLGTAMAMSTLLPIAHMLTTSARLSSDFSSGLALWYGNDRWYNIIVDLITPKIHPGYASQMNFAAPVLCAFAALWLEKRRKYTGLKIALVLEYLMLLLPAAAYIMTLFSTMNNRWLFIFAFTSALIYVFEAEHLRSLGRRDGLVLCGIFAAYTALAFYAGGGSLGIYRTCAVLALLASVILCLTMSRLRCAPRSGGAAMTGLVFICIVMNGYLLYAPDYGNFVSDFVDSGTNLSAILNSSFARINNIDDDSFYRVDTNLVTSNLENYSITLGYRTTSQYNSVVNGAMTYNLLETESLGIGAIHRFQNLDGRSVMEALACVKYYFTDADGAQHVPYGFEKVEELSDDDYAIYQNKYALSIGYTYDTCLDQDSYLTLSAAERESAQLTAAVVEDIPDGMAETTAAEISDAAKQEVVSVTLPDTGTDIKRTSYGYKAKSTDASVSIPYEKRAGYTCYLRLIGFSHTDIDNFVDVDTSDLHTTLLIRGPGTIYSLNRTEYIINLGYDEADSDDAVTLGFNKKGKYNLNSAELIYIPMDHYAEQIAARSVESLNDVSLTINTVSGTADITGTKLMTFSIPYSKGWHLRVDGVDTPLLQVNTGWLGAVLTEGHHEIVLSYTTPWAIPGRCAALAGWLIFILLALRGRRKHRDQHLRG